MGQVSATSTVVINAAPDAVLTAVADYQSVRERYAARHGDRPSARGEWR